MSQGHSATMNVDLVWRQTKQLHVCQRNDTEGLVDLERINLILLNAGMLKGFGDRKGRCGSELGRILRSVAPTQDFCNRLEVSLLQHAFRHQHKRRSSIRKRRCISCRHSATIFLEARLQRPRSLLV